MPLFKKMPLWIIKVENAVEKDITLKVHSPGRDVQPVAFQNINAAVDAVRPLQHCRIINKIGIMRKIWGMLVFLSVKF